MKGIVIAGLVMILVAAVPFAVLAEPRGETRNTGSFSIYEVHNPNHTQVLGGHSTHACNGLFVAAQHSHVVKDPPPPTSGGSSGGSSSSGSGTTVTSGGPGTL